MPIKNGSKVIRRLYQENNKIIKAYLGSEKIFLSDLLYQQRLENPNAFGTPVLDNFGWDLVANDDYLVVSARGEGDSSVDEGVVYVFSTSDYSLLYTLANPNSDTTNKDDNFGRQKESISLYNNTLLIGAYTEDNNGNADSGKVYEYNLTNGNLVFTYTNPNLYLTEVGDYFGLSTAINEDYIVIAAPYESTEFNQFDSSGVIYVYNRITRQLIHQIPNYNLYYDYDDDYFGWNVAINNNNYIVVRAYREVGQNSGIPANIGICYVFNASNGQFVSALESPDKQSFAYFGSSIAFHENNVFVGADAQDSETYDAVGIVFKYDIETGNLISTIESPIQNNNQRFGSGMTVFYDLLVVGSFGYNLGGFQNFTGAMYTFNAITDEYIQTEFHPFGTANGGGFFGLSMASNSSTVFVGAPLDNQNTDTDSGYVYIYE